MTRHTFKSLWIVCICFFCFSSSFLSLIFSYLLLLFHNATFYFVLPQSASIIEKLCKWLKWLPKKFRVWRFYGRAGNYKARVASRLRRRICVNVSSDRYIPPYCLRQIVIVPWSREVFLLFGEPHWENLQTFREKATWRKRRTYQTRMNIPQMIRKK